MKLKPSAAKKSRHLTYRTSNKAGKNKLVKLARHLKKHPEDATAAKCAKEFTPGSYAKKPSRKNGNFHKAETGYLVVGTRLDKKGKEVPVYALVGFDRPNGYVSNALKNGKVSYKIEARARLV